MRLEFLLVLLLVACERRAPAPAELAGGADEVTFLVAADTHIGAEGMAERNERQVDAMNALPGTPWPREIGGVVAEPAAVLVAGDLTESGRVGEWTTFVRLYGLTGKEGRLRWPVFEGTGNHDRPSPFVRPVVAAVAARHGGLPYAISLGELRLLCLDEYPDARGRAWLRRELARLGPDAPVVIWFHYPFTGPYSDWWDEDEKQAFREVVEGHRIVAVFHGHYHASGRYGWEGLTVYNVGSPRWRDRSFAVARWRDGRLDVASRDWSRGAWAWHHSTTAAPAGSTR